MYFTKIKAYTKKKERSESQELGAGTEDDIRKKDPSGLWQKEEGTGKPPCSAVLGRTMLIEKEGWKTWGWGRGDVCRKETVKPKLNFASVRMRTINNV